MMVASRPTGIQNPQELHDVIRLAIAIGTSVAHKARQERVVLRGNYVTVKRSSQVDATLGSHIRARRKSIGMTQSELAASMGISFQQVQKYEKGISAISMSRLQQICDIMHLPPEFFLNETSDYLGKPAVERSIALDGKIGNTEHFLATSEGRHLVRSFTAIRDGKLRTRILDFIAAVAADQQN